MLILGPAKDIPTNEPAELTQLIDRLMAVKGDWRGTPFAETASTFNAYPLTEILTSKPSTELMKSVANYKAYEALENQLDSGGPNSPLEICLAKAFERYPSQEKSTRLPAYLIWRVEGFDQDDARYAGVFQNREISRHQHKLLAGVVDGLSEGILAFFHKGWMAL